MELAPAYRAYIDCLNARDWARLGDFVAGDVVHNDRPLGLAGYRAMLEGDVEAIPDLRFELVSLVSGGVDVAARLAFDCHPKGMLFGLPVNGRRVRFAEHVFYRYHEGRIAQVWSLIDTAGIAAQL
ncbi:ester cyclase [Oceanicella sp. SM1341]|uniref:ester cyclase n=1 Tax=Oceanicella sp. SM1341 TaxID=1548889 RepID=UPI000E544E9C|nr:ester cyclase [Oceanicella sp. SM1341]